MTADSEGSSLLLAPGGMVLHIGVHKTGTTAIQASLANSRPVLETLKIRYPGTRQAHRLIASSAMDRRLGWRVGGSAAPDPNAWKDFVRSAHLYEGTTVCSSEFFAESSNEIAERIVSQVGRKRIHVVVTLRNLARILPSAWQQILKSGYETGYEPWLHQIFASEFAEPKPQTFWNRHHHDRVVQRWAALVGPENLTVVVVDDANRDGIYLSFERLLGLPGGTLLNHRDAAPNRSMTLAEAELLRHLNIAVGGAMGWGPYSDKVHDGLIKGMIERRMPGPDEARLQTPQWALDRAAEFASVYVDAIRASGVHVIGDLNLLSEHLHGPEVVEDAEITDMPIAAALAAMLGVLEGSRTHPESSNSSGFKRFVTFLQSQLTSSANV
ncbi:MAG: hypothetical protein PHN51_10875 [Candidatus Nanopelagicales bacterium]|nr:hypothetical protein [Candidatus Nanopelagicales bacterium]